MELMNLISRFTTKEKTEEKSVKEIIEEIHEDFLTEVDKLLAEAKILKSTDTTQQGLIDKAERLRKLGFASTKEVQRAWKETARLNSLKAENYVKQELVKAIDYFSTKYPQYKFITEDSVKKICGKYNLIYGKVEYYIGNVPEKNLQHIEQFKIHGDDECYERRIDSFYNRSLPPSYITKSESEALQQQELQENTPRTFGEAWHEYKKCSLEIAAPASDFNTSNMEIENFQLKEQKNIPDPVVLKPVIFNHKKYYLIVTAWGDEASDELVVNQRMN